MDTLSQVDIDSELLSKVARYTDSLVMISDSEDRIIWVNDSITQKTGYELSELKGKRARNVFRGPDTDDQTAAAIDEANREGAKYEHEILNYTKDDEPFCSI